MPDDETVSTGQDCPATPEQVSCGSQIASRLPSAPLVPGLQTVPDGLTTSAGQLGPEPVQFSAGSQKKPAPWMSPQNYDAMVDAAPSSMSCAHLLSVLFADHLRFDVKDPAYRGNDRFVMSKGHAAPALYAVLKAKAPCLPVLLQLDRVAACDTPTAVFGIGFQHERFQAAFGQMQRGGKSRQSAADDERVRRRVRVGQVERGL